MIQLRRILLKNGKLCTEYQIFSFDDAKEDRWLKFQTEPKNNKGLREVLINSNIKITLLQLELCTGNMI